MRIYLCVQVRDRAEPVAQDSVSLSLSFTTALQGVHALSGNGTNKKEHLFLHFWLQFFIFLSFFQVHLLCWAHIAE